MSKEELLIGLLKSEQKVAELYKSTNAEIEGTKKFFNEIRNRFPKLKIKEIRKKLYEKEKIDKYFKELEKNKEKKVKKYQEENAEELKMIKKSLEKLKENLKKYHNKYDQDYKGIRYIEHLFNKISEDYSNQ